MPNWITPSLAWLTDHKVGELIDALRTEALASGQTDPMPRIVTEVTDELRAAIAFSGKYTLDADVTTVPKGLKEVATKKIVRLMKGRLELSLSDDEKRDADIYESRLKAINEGKWPIDDPDTAIADPEVQSAVASPRIRKKCRQFSRADGDGS
jgi:hypothetical protein